MLRGLFLAIDWRREKGCQVRAGRGRKSLLSSCEGINCSSSWLSGHVYSGEEKLINSQWVTQLTGKGANYNRAAPSATISRKVWELKVGSAAQHFKVEIIQSDNQSINQSIGFYSKGVKSQTKVPQSALQNGAINNTRGNTNREESQSHFCWSVPQSSCEMRNVYSIAVCIGQCTVRLHSIWPNTLYGALYSYTFN